MPRFYHGGRYRPPVELRDLSIDMMRSHLYPRHPETFRRALQEQLDGPHPPEIYFPLRMSQTRFKDDGSGMPPREYGASGRSAAEAMLQRGEQSRELYNAAGVPVAVVTPGRQADQLGATGAPFDFDPEVYEVPVPRGVLPAGRMQATPAELEELMLQEHERALHSRVAVSTRTSRAMAQVAAAQSAMDVITEDDVALPFWRR